MNRKRILSIVVLAAVLSAQALPAHAGRMLCPMKEESRVQVACTACDAKEPDASSGLFRSRGCCHMEQGSATNETPVILSASRRAASLDEQSLLAAPVRLLASAGPDGAVRAMAWSGPPGSTLLASKLRTTVLRN
jgi:hypothetical protein